ncbi:C40 family peptidase [Desulfatirhabdium butyrativorans]|uniref:C40 family peptidase n=1 Tax=Desulfatirhabdium butyrativorans TaxID=340467 RepID=UPI00040D5CC2|nr:C40 family peptidase [Desulfatirhabdium butyrativorans]
MIHDNIRCNSTVWTAMAVCIFMMILCPSISMGKTKPVKSLKTTKILKHAKPAKTARIPKTNHHAKTTEHHKTSIHTQTAKAGTCPSPISHLKSTKFENSAQPILHVYGMSDEQFEDKIQNYLGIPYRPNGTSRQGMDCSGFVSQFYRSYFGIQLPHNSLAQYQFSSLHRVDEEEMEPGDLVFFRNPKNHRINHVGMYLSDGQFVHASSSEGVTISSLDENYWKKRFVGSKRVMAFNRKGPEETFDMDAGVDIPIGPRNDFSTSVRNEIPVEKGQPSSDVLPGLNDRQAMAYLDAQRTHHVEISYAAKAANDAFKLNVAAIHESVYPQYAWLNPADLRSGAIDFRPSVKTDSKDDASLPLNRLGYKLSGDFQPSSWLTITPSVLIYDYPAERWQGYEVPKRTFGLNTQLNPLGNRYSLNMAIHYADQEDVTRSVFSDSLNTWDMALRLGIQLNDRWQFNIVGQHDIRSNASDASESIMPALHDLYMGFDFTY